MTTSLSLSIDDRCLRPSLESDQIHCIRKGEAIPGFPLLEAGGGVGRRNSRSPHEALERRGNLTFSGKSLEHVVTACPPAGSCLELPQRALEDVGCGCVVVKEGGTADHQTNSSTSHPIFSSHFDSHHLNTYFSSPPNRQRRPRHMSF